jgi:O-antigen/teichoic acid export membrane protein
MRLRRSVDSVNTRIKGALLANGLSRAARVFEQLALIPLLLAGWGVQLYGEWLALVSVAGFAVITSLGVGHAASSDIVLMHARDRNVDASNAFTTSIVLISISIAAGFSGLWLVLSFLDLSELASLRTLHVSEARTIAMILSAAVLLGLYCEPLGGVLGAAVGSVAPNMIYAGCKLIEIAAVGLAIFHGAGPYAIAVIVASVSAISVVVHAWCVIKWAPWLSCFPIRLDGPAIRRNLRPAAGFFIIFISMNLAAVNLPRLIVSHALGAAALAAFTVIVTYTKTARSVASMISQSMQVELGRSWAKARRGQTRRIAESMVNGALAFVVILLAIEIAAAPLVIPVWTHGQIALSWALLLALACVALVGAYFDATMLAVSAFNQVGRLAVWYAAFLAVALGTALVVLPPTGNSAIIGVCLLAPELAGAWSATRTLRQVVGRIRIRPWSLFRH